MTGKIASILRTSGELKTRIANDSGFLESIGAAAETLKQCVASGGTIYACGNGGSVCDAMHFCEELVARYKRERPGIRAVHFGDPGILTCWSNDYEYSGAFERCVKTFCRKGDVLVAISTSGNSENVRRAVLAARELGTSTIGLLGKDGGKLKGICDTALVIPSNETERIQEVHITLIHIFCELLET